jgi:hypothetical protein
MRNGVDHERVTYGHVPDSFCLPRFIPLDGTTVLPNYTRRAPVQVKRSAAHGVLRDAATEA